MFSSFLWGNSSEASVAFDKSHLLKDDLTLSKHLSTSDLLAQNIPDPNKLIKEAQREAAEAAKRKKEAEKGKQKEEKEAAEREEQKKAVEREGRKIAAQSEVQQRKKQLKLKESVKWQD